MGRNHMRAISESEKVQVVAVAEPSPSARTALESTGLALHTHLESMLDAGGLDGVLVCVPSTMHLDTVKRLVSAGIPILCEKPVGVTTQEAREATHLAAQASLPLQVGFWRRFVPMLKQLKERISAGELGEIYLVVCSQWDGQPPGAYFRTHSGGIFIDMGVHEFDQTRWLTGQEFGAISALASGVAAEPWAGDPESAQALCELSGGSSALVSLGRRFPLGDVCKVEVFGTRGAEDCKFLWPPTADDTFFEALKVQAESFAAHVGGATLEGASGDDAAAAIAAAERAAGLMAKGVVSP
jgi:myo-inositol 2-dehydrogenase/D-chiro-inositol 1-dehydrogenase